MADKVPCEGYVFDGALLLRARVDNTDLVVNDVTGEAIGIIPSLAPWYTRREVQNAVARYQQKYPSDQIKLSAIAPTPQFMAELKSGHPRATRDHILHLLTAGKRKVLGRDFTAQEISDYEAQADSYAERIERRQVEFAKKTAAA